MGTKKPPVKEAFLIVLARTYFPLLSIIGAEELNFRVRNGIGCDLFARRTRGEPSFLKDTSSSDALLATSDCCSRSECKNSDRYDGENYKHRDELERYCDLIFSHD